MTRALQVTLRDGTMTAHWRTLLETLPHHPFRWYWWRRLGEAWHADGNGAEWVRALQQATGEYPDDAALRTDLAAAYLAQAVDLPTVRELLERTIQQSPGYAEAYIVYARAYVQEEQYDEALHWYAEGIRRDSSVWAWRLEQADAAAAMGDIRLAIELYEAVLAQHPYAHPYFEVAWLYRQVDQPTQAVGAIEAALRLRADAGAPYFIRAGLIYEWLGDTTKARAMYLEAQRRDPHDNRARDGLQRLDSEPKSGHD